MISAEQIRAEENQIQLPVMFLAAARSRPHSQVRAAESLRHRLPYEVHLSGTQLLVGFLSALSTIGLLLWALLELWLFEH
ncbi:MAG: hypothetical protein ABSG16_03735 [Candidatus Acidiferrum sp.]|jgi:hypothetical protein